MRLGVPTLRRRMSALAKLNPQQREAVETVRGPVLILAGAGTGKTRVITCRIARLMAGGVAPGAILAVTFTNKAAREMQERVRQLTARRRSAGRGSEVDHPTLCTFHSLCVRILRRYGDRLGYKPNFVIYDEAEQLSVVKRILSRMAGSEAKVDAAAVLSALSKLRNGGTVLTGEEQKVAAIAEHIRGRYESALQACNAMDFDDLILLVLRLFEGDREVLEACQRKYQYVMVDEYQDTNAAQFRLVHALTREHRNLCVVGDDDQSIYGWRGAEIANLLDMERHYPEVKVIKLEQNYRSTATILEAANALIRHNARRRPKQLWSAVGAGAPLSLEAYADEEEEARAVVDTIEFDRSIRGVPWSEQAVLFRTNAQSRALETALRRASVRYHLVGGQSFFDRREIRDFLAYLKLLLNPHDDISLLRMANVPARGLSDTTMERLLAASHARRCSVYGVMQRPDAEVGLTTRAWSRVGELVDWVERTRSGLSHEPGLDLRQWAEGWLRECGYIEELRRSERDTEAAESRVRNVLDLAASLETAGSGGPAMERLEQFLEELTLDRERQQEEQAGEAVTLITMHSCKGLEFPQVRIVGLEEGLLPHARSQEEGTLDEERRLFYVAITRAQRMLALSHCGARRKHGQLVPCHPSRFLRELPDHLVEAGSSRRPVSVEQARSIFAGLKASLE